MHKTLSRYSVLTSTNALYAGRIISFWAGFLLQSVKFAWYHNGVFHTSFQAHILYRYDKKNVAKLFWIITTSRHSDPQTKPRLYITKKNFDSYNKSQQDALFLNFILVKNSAFRADLLSIIRVLILFSQQLEWQIPVAVNTVLRLLMTDSTSGRNM